MSRHWLARDIALVIALKLVVITLASLFVFGEAQRPVIDDHAIEQRFLAGDPATERDW